MVRSLSLAAAIAGTMVIVITCLSLYAPFARDFFVLDDFIWLHAAGTPDTAQFVRDATGFPEATAYTVPTPFWRPLIDAYFFLTWRLFGLNPMPYHLAAIGIHAANALLLVLLVRRLTGSRLVSFLIGFLWAIQPAYDYAVVWISEATELIATFWYLLTLVLFVAYLHGDRRRWPLAAGALVSMTLALLAKQSSITIPVLLVLLALVHATPRGWREGFRLSRLLSPFIFVAIIYGLFLFQNDYRTSADAGMYAAGPHALANIWDYLLRLTWPFVTPGEHIESVTAAAAAVLFLALGCLAVV
ncbi:MAG: hypothetical protein AB7U18_09705, partial [Dehalococcoidia bacterium]